MCDTERSIYVAVLVVEHAPGVGHELDNAGPREWSKGVRANLVEWMTGTLQDEETKNDDDSLFYAVRDVTLYHEADFTYELAEHGSIEHLPQVRTNPPSTELESRHER